MCTYNTISSPTDHFRIQEMDSEESLLTFVNLFLTVCLGLCGRHLRTFTVMTDWVLWQKKRNLQESYS